MLGTNPVKDMVESGNTIESLFDRWKPRTWYQEVWWWIRYGIWNWIGWKGEIWMYLWRFWQRGRRGYGTSDVWGCHYHLADVISGSIKELLDMAHGHPCDVKDLDEWKDILSQILWTFNTAKNISERDWLYLSPENRNEVEMKKMHEFAKELNKKSKKHRLLAGTKYHVMTYAECERYEKGWELLRRYYFGLWD